MFLFEKSVLLNILLRTAIVYILLLVGIRLTGKREVGQLTPFDLVLLLLISNAVQNAMTGPDTSLLGGIVAAITLLTLNSLVTFFSWRYKKIRRLIEGVPVVVIHNGKILSKNLAKEKISMDLLHQVLREHGIADINEVCVGMLEIDGSISFIKKDKNSQ